MDIKKLCISNPRKWDSPSCQILYRILQRTRTNVCISIIKRAPLTLTRYLLELNILYNPHPTPTPEKRKEKSN